MVEQVESGYNGSEYVEVWYRERRAGASFLRMAGGLFQELKRRGEE